MATRRKAAPKTKSPANKDQSKMFRAVYEGENLDVPAKEYWNLLPESVEEAVKELDDDGLLDDGEKVDVYEIVFVGTYRVGKREIKIEKI